MRRMCLIAGLAFVAACTDSFDPVPNGKQLSIVDAGELAGLPSGIVVSDTVRAGLVTVRFHSFGSSTCNRPDGEDVVSDVGSVTITAYDKYVPPKTACTDNFGSYPRDVMVSLAAGPVQIRVRGKSLLNGGTTVELHKEIVVLP